MSSNTLLKTLNPLRLPSNFGVRQCVQNYASFHSRRRLLSLTAVRCSAVDEGRTTPFSSKKNLPEQTRPVSTSAAAQETVQVSDTMGLRHIPHKGLHVSTPTWWLESRFHFSFAEYFNPSNAEFGVLRVLNDDLVQPHSGFGTHPHRDMEIFTYIIDGQLTHKDSMGTAESLGRGSAQYMSAGTGVTHSEMNAGNELLRFLQIWIKPNARGLKPNYGSRVFSKAERHNKLQHLLTSFDRVDKDSGNGVIPIHQDANIYVSELDAGKAVSFPLEKRRQAYLVCIEGKLSVLGAEKEALLEARDAAEIVAPKGQSQSLTFKADDKQGAHLLVIEMAQSSSGSSFI